MEEIRVEDLSFSYGKKKILKEINITGEKGQCIGIIGANGCGKSTLLSILAGNRKPDGGRIFYQGTEMTAGKNSRLFFEKTGFVPQENSLIQELTVWDNLILWYTDKKRLTEELQSGFLQSAGLWEMRKKRISRLSGGMRKKVSIGCALAGHPSILILDEPGTALDLFSKKELRKFLKSFRDQGGTVILSTHDEKELEFCDRLYLIRDGVCEETDGMGFYDTDKGEKGEEENGK